MNSKNKKGQKAAKKVQRMNLLSLFPQVIVMGVLIFIWKQLKVDNPFVFAAVSYLALFIFLRNYIPKDHRRGVALIRKEEFKDAIPYLEKSYQFFKKNNWVDEYKHFTLLNSSSLSYKEVALINMAFCYGQLKEYDKAKETYKRAFKDFPNSYLAEEGYNFLKSRIEEELKAKKGKGKKKIETQQKTAEVLKGTTELPDIDNSSVKTD